jgi:hypothetical protein
MESPKVRGVGTRSFVKSTTDRRPVFAADQSALPRDRQGTDVDYGMVQYRVTLRAR